MHIDMQTTLLKDQTLHLNSFQVVNDRSANSSMKIKIKILNSSMFDLIIVLMLITV